MPRINLKSPGSIPNHKLLKNLELNGKYLSNNGEDKGITVNDEGAIAVTATTTDPDTAIISAVGSITAGGINNFTCFKQEINKTIDHGASGYTNMTAAEFKASSLVNTANTTTLTGVETIVNCQHAADAGVAIGYGQEIKVTGNGNGTNTLYGLILDVSGGTQNHGLLIDVDDVGGYDLKIRSSNHNNDFFSIKTQADGVTTLWTTASSGSTNANLNVTAGGILYLKGGTSNTGLQIDTSGEVVKIGQDTPSDGQVLTWDNSNSKVVWASGGGGASALNDLSDVTYSSGDLTISSLDTIISGALT